MDLGEILLGSFLGSFFQVLLDRLASLGLDFAQRGGISNAMIEKWKRMLGMINAVLDDAEDKQLTGNDPVKVWMDNARDLAYDMEDLLDTFAIEAAQAKLEAESSTSRGQVKRKFSFFGRDKSSGSYPSPSSLVSVTKAQEINDRLQEIVNQKDVLSLIEKPENRSDNSNKRRTSTSLPEPRTFGRDKEAADILKLLTREAETGDTTLTIVPIVGMGGIGKTTLAQLLYNDARVVSCFEIRAWVCVSDVFDIFDITKTILQSITTGSSHDGKDLNKLQVDLKDSLSKKKFLVVLDDVWNERYGEWTTLMKPFGAGSIGSKIIITTRNLPVVKTTGASPYLLKELSHENCTSLLAFHALGTTNFERHPHLEAVGKKIAEKCKGLPLAAKMMGGLLRSERDPIEWEAILNNKIWDHSTGEKDEVLPILKLSYVHLPSYMKRCFAYCAITPKDYEMERDELVFLWISEGFLDGQKAKDDILKLGRNCFDELVSRSFLQQSSANTSKFSMHDLLNDLANSIARGTCFSSGESQLEGNLDDASLDKTRYASFVPSLYVTRNCMRAYHKMKVLRSLILLNRWDVTFSISNKVLQDLLIELKYLRAFSLSHCSITEVPDCFGDLKHIRYLNFSYTNIEMLPESIGALCKLQALILRGCRRLSMLPSCIVKLINLEFLDIRDTSSLKEIPLGISNLKNLIILSKFVIGQDKGSQLKELRKLPNLQGELSILELQKVEEIRDAVDANMFNKQGLSNLSLHWGKGVGNLQNDNRQSRVLNSLRPHTNLEDLTISDYLGEIFPSWLGDRSYLMMVSLCLQGCRNVTSLPSLGQLPSLKKLSLEGLHAVKMIGSEVYGCERPFSSLTTLEFEDMLAWKDWCRYAEGREEEVSFSCLQHLVVQKCPSLVGTLPHRLDRLTKLEICSCPHLDNSIGTVCLPSLRELYLADCSKEILKSLVNLTSLTILKIENIVGLVGFDRGFTSCLVKLKELFVRRCDKLTYLWQDGMEMQSLTCLQEFVIESCPSFTFFVDGELERGGELHCNLERMELRECESVEKLPSKIHTLRYLTIVGCPKITGAIIPQDGSTPSSNNPMYQLESLVIGKCYSPISLSFAEGRFAALKTLHIEECEGMESLEEITVDSLEYLYIKRCKNLRSLPRSLHTLSHLTHLQLWNCPALEIEEEFPLFPITLSSLELFNCPKIKSIGIIPNNLTKLRIYDCPALEMEEFPPLPITLSSFILENCWKIKCLPNQWHHLPSLHHIRISYCPSIEGFPKGGFPPNLQSLSIQECENVKEPMGGWGSPFLTSLQTLSIDGRNIVGEKICFPSDDDGDAWSLLFPSSLTSLHIHNMRKVERLSSGLRSHLPSLRDFCIWNCPNLRDLPEDGLPPSLHHFGIHRCPILKDPCSKLTGHNWPLIQHIPSITIDWVLIQ